MNKDLIDLIDLVLIINKAWHQPHYPTDFPVATQSYRHGTHDPDMTLIPISSLITSNQYFFAHHFYQALAEEDICSPRKLNKHDLHRLYHVKIFKHNISNAIHVYVTKQYLYYFIIISICDKNKPRVMSLLLWI